MEQLKRMRAGVITTAALFIGAGFALLCDLNGWWDIPGDVWRWWPLLPLALGIEIVLTQLIYGRQTVVILDGLSLALVVVLAGASIMYQAGGPALHMSGTVEHRLTVTETLTSLGSVKKVRLINPLGTTEVKPSDDGSVSITAEMVGRANGENEARTRAEEMSLHITNGELLTIQVMPEDRRNQICHLVVAVPAELLLEVENKFGGVEVRDRRASLLVKNGFGSTQVQNIDGDVQLENEMGSVDVEQVTGNVTIQNSHGRVTVLDVSGELDISNSFAAVEIDGVGGVATVRNQNGSISADGVRQGGTLATTFASIKASEVGDSLNCRSQNGSIELHDVAGDIEAITSFGTIHLAEFSGAVKAINQNGRITLETSTSLTKDLELRSSFGPIVLKVPETSSLEIDAETTFASISGDSLTISKQGNTTTAKGQIGTGAAKALLRTSNGSIDIAFR